MQQMNEYAYICRKMQYSPKAMTTCNLTGNDLNEEITPVEAGLTWTIGKRRREACDFLGGEVMSGLG